MAAMVVSAGSAAARPPGARVSIASIVAVAAVLVVAASACAPRRSAPPRGVAGEAAGLPPLAGDRGRAAPAPGDARPEAGADGLAPSRADARASATEPPVQSAAIPPSAPGAPAAPRDDDGPLVAKIDRATPPRRAAALRLTEQARALLAGGDHARAVELLERAVAVDARTPYAYYFLAEAHDALGHGAVARSFVVRAEQLFATTPYWLARVRVLHGKIAEEEGRPDEARRQYERALGAWPQSGDATAALARLDAAGQGAR